jgi:hypothetical protein
MEMVTAGGLISGYWATGRLTSASVPAKAIRMDTTAAKIGRSMKKRLNMNPCLRPEGAVENSPGRQPWVSGEGMPDCASPEGAAPAGVAPSGLRPFHVAVQPT